VVQADLPRPHRDGVMFVLSCDMFWIGFVQLIDDVFHYASAPLCVDESVNVNVGAAGRRRVFSMRMLWGVSMCVCELS
jgi:hypothetical protein